MTKAILHDKAISLPLVEQEAAPAEDTLSEWQGWQAVGALPGVVSEDQATVNRYRWPMPPTSAEGFCNQGDT